MKIIIKTKIKIVKFTEFKSKKDYYIQLTIDYKKINN